MITWHIGEPPENGAYLVTVRLNNRSIVQSDYWMDPIGFVDWHDDVIAWTELPEPYDADKNRRI